MFHAFRPVVLAAALAAACLAPAAFAQSDLAQRLLAEVQGVLPASSGVALLITEGEGDAARTRQVSPGDDYRDGWRFESITAARVVLRKGPETLAVDLADRRAEITSESSQAVNLTNAGSEALRAALRVAVARGDLRQVLASGGSASDLSAAVRSPDARSSVNALQFLPESGTEQFINQNGLVGLAGFDAQGRRVAWFDPSLEGTPVPTDAPVAGAILNLPASTIETIRKGAPNGFAVISQTTRMLQPGERVGARRP